MISSISATFELAHDTFRLPWYVVYEMQSQLLCGEWLLYSVQRSRAATVDGESFGLCPSAAWHGNCGRNVLSVLKHSTIVQVNWVKLTGFYDLVADFRLAFRAPTHGPNMQVLIGALVVGACMAIAYFIYSWSPFRRLEGWMKMALRLIFAPGALGDWQQQLVKRQVRRHA